MDSSIFEINSRSKNMDSAQPSKLPSLVCEFLSIRPLKALSSFLLGIPRAAGWWTALLFDRNFYYSYLIMRRLAGRRKNFTFNNQLLIGTCCLNCKMPLQSGNLSGRNNTTGLDTFQPPLSLDGGPDILLDYFSLYAAFSFALQRPDALILSQISLSFTTNSTAEFTKMQAKIKYFNLFSTSENTHSNVCMPLFNFYMRRNKFESSPGLFWNWCWTFECSYSRTFLILSPSCFTTTS